MVTISEFRIRRMGVYDLPAVLHIDHLVFSDPWPESVYKHELYANPVARYFVLELLDPAIDQDWSDKRTMQMLRLLGYTGMRVEGTRGHISTLALRPDWHGHKLGELLFLTGMVQGMRDGAETMALEVRVTNDVAEKLYRKYGFEILSHLHKYYTDGGDAYLMKASYLEESYRQHLYHRLLTLIEVLKVNFQGW